MNLRIGLRWPIEAGLAVAAAGSLFLTAGCAGAGGGGNSGVTLAFASGLPENLYASAAFKDWSDDVTELSNGRVKFENYFGGSLVPQGDVAKAVSDGQVELGQFLPAGLPDQFEYANIDSVPGAASDIGAVIEGSRKLYESNRSLRDEWASNGMVPLLNLPVSANVFVSRKELNSVEDFKGLRVRAAGLMVSAMEDLGAATVTLPQVEIYEGLQRGVVDVATSLTLPSAALQSFGDVADRVYDVGLSANGSLVVAMNKQAYDELPADLRDVLAEANENADKAWVDRLIASGAAACGPLAEQGVELIEWSAANKKAVQDKTFSAAQATYKATLPDGEKYWTEWGKLMQDYDGKYGHFDGSDLATCLG
ncbi:TRAP transporter substrate-binding protein DctP [Nocardia rhamnosiphila]